MGGGLGQFADLRGVGLGKKEGVVFLRGPSYPNAHYGSQTICYILTMEISNFHIFIQ